MRKFTVVVVFTFTCVCLPTADAQLFGRKSKTPPAQRVGELIVQAKSDPSESKRGAAAGELREFDPKSYPEVVAVLIDLARNDKSASVRHEAIDSLSRLRPVSQEAGQTIEWAAAHDDSWRVRWQAKTALTRYQWAGYRAGKNDSKTTPPSTLEPPLLDASRAPVKTGAVGRTTTGKSNQPPAAFSQPPALPKVVNQPPATPVIVTQPQPQVVQQPAPSLPTPPPIIIEAPPGVAIAPALKAPIPAIPVVDHGPKTGAPPPLPVIAPPATTEPNFRPAGQAPPRTPPPAKNDDRGPVLTPPM